MQPLAAGTYKLTDAGRALGSAATPGTALATGSTAGSWSLAPTSDGYYTLTDTATGLCADVKHGTTNGMGVVEQEGAGATAETCAPTESQKWQLEPVPGGYRIVDAITQQALQAPAAGGPVVQQPRDAARGYVWRFTTIGGKK
ncbi:RICIN domain-containing protein [Actinacidiphila yeochonensis]|uniref:RICIN domain-containing protein n=1 Tax=Actinacidiphila yeochonensis TaxID=89050 RepID=UPI00068E8849|nr:RICIN domain-containing protein [Actinacidiphila yeochonensis]